MQATDLAPQPEELYTINAGGFSATADAFARDPDSYGLWFLSMVGSQTAVKAIWAAPAQAAAGPRPHHQGARTGRRLAVDTSGASSPARPWGPGRRR